MFEEEELDLDSSTPILAPASPRTGNDCQQTLPQTEKVVGSDAGSRTDCRLTAPVPSPPTSPSATRAAVPPVAPPAALLDPRRKRVLPAWMLAAVAGSTPSGPKGVLLDFSSGFLILLGFYWYSAKSFARVSLKILLLTKTSLFCLYSFIK